VTYQFEKVSRCACEDYECVGEDKLPADEFCGRIKHSQQIPESVDHHTHYLALVEIRELKARIEVLEAELARDPFVRDGWQTPRASRIRALLSDEMRQQTQPLDVQL